jgi:ABC-type polysaccharide/polyol phosphate export permease
LAKGDSKFRFDILKDLCKRNLKLKYASAFLGILWAGLIPLLLMFAISFAFIKVLRLEEVNFPLFVLSGILPWLYFSSSIMESTRSLLSEKAFIKQFSYSKAIYPLSIVFSNLIQHLIGVAFLFPIFIFYNWKLILLVPILAIGMVLYTGFITGLSLLAAMLNVYIRDLEHFLGVFLMLLFWLTPIFYHREMIPSPYDVFIQLNPLSHFIAIYQVILFKGQLPPLLLWVKVTMLCLLGIGLSWFIFKKYEGKLEKKL